MILRSNLLQRSGGRWSGTKVNQTLLAVQSVYPIFHITERLWHPSLREILSFGVPAHCSSTIFGDQSTTRIEDCQMGNTLTIACLAQECFGITVLVRESLPRHFSKIFLERSFIPVRGNKNDFHLVFETSIVPLSQLWCKASAWRAPVRREVQCE